MSELHRSPRTEIKRGRKRSISDLDTAKQIINDSLLCHVAQVINDQPFVTPTCHWLDGDKIYWHGHVKARNVVGSLQSDVCLNICQLDGLVLARSAFHHSVNYRSVTVFGQPQLVTDEQEKLRQLEIFINKVSPNRWSQLRPVTEKELMITSVVSLDIKEASIKVRAEGVNDDKDDLSWPVWAGVLPVKSTWQRFVPDEALHNQKSDNMKNASLKKTAHTEFAEPEKPALFQAKVFAQG